ncbi:MAG: hypothetical protein D6711_09715 [Chloroflexi bacterium]|nr:MAG: hypothetical protein D6711_09715 [Chloroflexota bacterium]
MSNSWGIHGHDWAVEYLQRGMQNNRIRHAYLFTGTSSIGKNTLAHAFAIALNCQDERCRKRIMTGNHPDIIYSETDPRTGTLKIESIRAVANRIAMKPYEGRYRIAIFQDFDHAQPRAQDALLKTLEEPPPYAILILLAESTENLLSTITSRVQTIYLRPVEAAVIRDTLIQHYHTDEETATLLGRFSGGRIGWAIQAAQDPTILEQRTQALDLLDGIIRANRIERFHIADDLSKDKLALIPLIDLWLTYWRDLLLMIEGSPVKVCNIDRQATLEQFAYQITRADVLKAIRATQTFQRQLGISLNLRLALEVLFLDYPTL